MNNLLRLIQRFHLFFVFIILEAIALLLLVNHNNYQHTRFYNSGNSVAGTIYKKTSNLHDYFMLIQTNKDLAEENVMLKNLILHNQKPNKDSLIIFNDSVIQANHNYIAARIINNSVNKIKNYITLDKGSLDGITPEMGVVSPRGVVGKIIQCSDHYSVVIPIINPRLRISTKIAKNNFFGSLVWDGLNPQIARLEEIPHHVIIEVGDRLITSGYSGAFPEGLLVGTIIDYKRIDGQNFYDISVKLSVDFNNLSYVEVIENKTINEQLLLEQSLLTDD